MPRRFLFAIRTYAPDKVGGGARSVQNLAEGLKGRGHDVHVVRLVPKGGEAKWQAEAEAAGLIGPDKPTLHFLPLRNIFWPYDLKPHGALAKALWHLRDLSNVAARRDFRALVEQVKPDVVNTSIIDGFSTAIFAAAKAGGAKLVHTMRDYYLVCQRSGMFRNGQNCETLCAPCKLSASVRRGHTRNVDLFLANSAYVADTNERFGAFPDGVPTLVQWNINERAPADGPKTLPADKVIFGFIGRIAPAKGLEKLLAAAERLREGAGRDWELIVAGTGEAAFEAELRARYAANPRIRFLGWSKPADFYDVVDVLCCPSTYNEPLPRVIYEGYGFALPTISADTGGIPEIVEDARSGYLYQADDVATLAERMERFRTMDADAYRGMSARALALADQFAPDTVLATYERRIEAVLAGDMGALV